MPDKQTDMKQEYEDHRHRQAQEIRKKEEYQDYVEQMTPKKNLLWQMLKAFVVGGLICVLGQVILNVATNQFGLDKETAVAWCSMLLVLLSVIFTGLNLYQKLGAFAGAGALVPITGFANSVASPAVEYQKEGQVFGIGAKIFTIAGPVILYGIFSSWLFGLIYWGLKVFGVIG